MAHFQTIVTYVVLLLPLISGEFQKDYMTRQCNKVLSGRTAGRFETSPSLTYDNLMDCYTTISVPEGKQIMIIFERLEFEDATNGACVDYLNIHDGPDTQSNRFNYIPVCSTESGLTTLTTTTNHVTFYFRSDNTAVYRGFDIVYTAFSPAPCSSGEYLCSNQLCVDLDLKCDGIEQCADGSDEGQQLCQEDTVEENKLDIALIVGCSVGGLVFLIIVIILLYKLIDYLKWKRFLKNNNFDRNPWDLTEDVYQYPVSDMYQKYDIGERGRREPRVPGIQNNQGKPQSTGSKGQGRPVSQKSAEVTGKRPVSAASLNETKKVNVRPDTPLSTYSDKKYLLT